MAKRALSDSQVADMRARYVRRYAKSVAGNGAPGWRSNSRELAAEFGVTPNYVNRIVRGVERAGASDTHPRNRPVEERLAEGLAQDGDCAIWTRGCTRRGYGQISIGDRDVATHRLAYELAHGPIPDGMCVRHKCDNPPCCNPEHLELGTWADNARDMLERGRHWAQRR